MLTCNRIINGLSVRFYVQQFSNYFFISWTTILSVIRWKVEGRAPAGCQLQYLDAHGN